MSTPHVPAHDDDSQATIITGGFRVDEMRHLFADSADLKTGQPETLQANLIMPEPCQFISPKLHLCSVIRPTGRGRVSAMGAVNSFTADGLFRGQSPAFFKLLTSLARAADAAQRSLD